MTTNRRQARRGSGRQETTNPRALGREYQVFAPLIRELARAGKPATEIYETLAKFVAESGSNARIPNVRSIQRQARSVKPGPGDEPWTLVTAQPDEAALVLPVLTPLALLTAGRAAHLTKNQAQWIARIRQMRPDIMTDTDDTRALDLYLLALAYADRVQNGESADDLDAYVIWAPWRNATTGDRRRKKDYDTLVEEGTLARSRHADLLLEREQLAAIRMRVETRREQDHARSALVRQRIAASGRLAELRQRLAAATDPVEHSRLEEQIAVYWPLPNGMEPDDREQPADTESTHSELEDRQQQEGEQQR